MRGQREFHAIPLPQPIGPFDQRRQILRHRGCRQQDRGQRGHAPTHARGHRYSFVGHVILPGYETSASMRSSLVWLTLSDGAAPRRPARQSWLANRGSNCCLCCHARPPPVSLGENLKIGTRDFHPGYARPIRASPGDPDHTGADSRSSAWTTKAWCPWRLASSSAASRPQLWIHGIGCSAAHRSQQARSAKSTSIVAA